MRVSAVHHMSVAQNLPHQNFQQSLKAVSVVARSGYAAVSIQDYSRISDERSEFLNFLLTPNPAGVPVLSQQGVLRAA